MNSPAPNAGSSSDTLFFKVLFPIVFIAGTILTLYIVGYETSSYKSEMAEQCKSIQQIISSNNFTSQDFLSLDSTKRDLLESQLNACYKALHLESDFSFDYKQVSLLIRFPDTLINISNSNLITKTKRIYQVSSSTTLKSHHKTGNNPFLFSIPYPLKINSLVSLMIPLSRSQDTIFISLSITLADWYAMYLKASLLPVLLTITLLLFAFLLKRKRFQNKFYSDIFFPEAFYIVIIGFLMTFGFGSIAYIHEDNTRTKSFNHISLSTFTPILNEINDVLHLRFEGFSRFFENSTNVERSEFYNYSSYLSADQNIRAWGWVSVVDSSMRALFESSMQNENNINYKIMPDSITSNNPITVGHTLYPVCYIEPLEPNVQLVGVDIGSDPRFLPVINDAIYYKKVSTTKPFRLSFLNDTSNHAFIFHPVFSKDSISSLKGLTFFIVDYNSLLQIPFTMNDNGPVSIGLSMYEIYTNDSVQCIASLYPENSGLKHSHNFFNKHTMVSVKPISAFGKNYALVAYAQHSFCLLHPMMNNKIILFGGSLITLILASLFALLKYHKVTLELQVNQRTAELKESDERFTQIAEQCGEMIWETDKNGLYTYVSHACELILGYSEEEVVGKKHIFDLHSEEGKELFKNQFLENVKDRQSISNSNSIAINKNGNAVYFLTNAVPVFNNDGSIKGYRGSHLDISEQKKAEQDKEKLQKELLQAQKMDSIGRLAGGIAHDFNNMLCAIMCNADLALSRASEKLDVEGPINDIISSAKRSSDLTRQLLAFARKQEINPTVLNLNETITAMLKMLQRLIGENISLSWTPGPGLWNTLIDKSQVDQILANLVVNARDAINGIGTIVIETSNAEFTEQYCSAQIESRPGKYTVITVTDTGCGMDKKTLSHIFEPFFTTKALGQGTGLGLATVYGIVKQNGGFIHVYSEPARGSSFRVYLPRYEGAVKIDEAPVVEKQIVGGTETILIVEDEETILLTAKAILKHAGYSVLTASNPNDAIALAQQELTIKILLTDVILPQMNGKELQSQIKSHIPDIKCILMSGYSANVISQQGIIEEGIEFLQKPFTRKILLEKIRTVIDC
jgi:PAS domain S-box-containing protein